MNSPIVGLRVASIIFGVIAIIQLLRVVFRAEVIVAGHHLPLWASIIAAIVLGGLSAWLWTLTRRRPPE